MNPNLQTFVYGVEETYTPSPIKTTLPPQPLPIALPYLKDFPSPEINADCQRLLFSYGYKWQSGDTIIRYKQGKCSICVTKNKGICIVTDGSSYNSSIHTTISNNHVEQLRKFLEALHPYQLPSPTTTTLMPPNPMDGIVEYVRQTLAAEIKQGIDTSVDSRTSVLTTTIETKLAELQSSMDKYVPHRIVIEDRRIKPPTEITVDEPCHSAMPELLGVIGSSCWPALVGPTGSGKTLGVIQCAKLLGINLVAIKQMTRIIAPHDLIGYMDAGGHYRKGAWTDCILGYKYETNGVPTEVIATDALICVDEMDNANENIIMLLKALQTGQIMMPYGSQQINPNLRVIATMNTWGTGATREYVGRCAQDAALLNEFQFIEWNYDESFEWSLLQRLFSSYTDTGEWKLDHMRKLLDMFSKMRLKATNQNIRVIIATRNVINVAKMLICNPSWRVSDVLKKSVFKGLKDEDIKRVECPEVWTDLKYNKPSKSSTVIDASKIPNEGRLIKQLSNDCPI